MSFKSKAEWAESKARELELTASSIRRESVFTNKVADKYRAATNCQNEASRFRRMAQAFRRRGV